MVRMIALKTWSNAQMEGHVNHGGGAGHVRRGREFEAIHEDRAKVLERHGLAARHPDELPAPDGGHQAAAGNPLERAPQGRRTSPVAASSLSSAPVRVPQAPISPQSVKRAGSTQLRAPNDPEPEPSKATMKATTKAASVPSAGKRTAPTGKGRQSR